MIVVAVINSTLYGWGLTIIIRGTRYDAWMAYRRLSGRPPAYFCGRTKYFTSLQPPPSLDHGDFIKVLGGGGGGYRRFIRF